MDTVLAVAVVLCAALVEGLLLPPPPLHALPPLPGPPPQKHFPGSVCPADSTCVREEECSRQCRVGWSSLGLSSCYLPGPAAPGASQAAGRADCAARGAHLPVLEEAAELSRLAPPGQPAQWTDATWQPAAAAWVWGTAGAPPVDFAALGTAAPADGSSTNGCLLLTPGASGVPQFEPAPCDDAATYHCETGSSSVARCARQKERLCCAVTTSHYREPCYVDEQGTRCEQRIREGYFPVGQSLVRPTEGHPAGQLSWHEARALCRADGGDLLTIDSDQMDEEVRSMLRDLARVGADSFYIGLSSNAAGEFSYVNGTAAETSSIFNNFALAADAAQPDACVYQTGEPFAWFSGVCSEPRDYVCLVGPVRHSLRREPATPGCGVRHTQGVLGKSGLPLPPLPLPLLPPLGLADDGRRGAAQFGEITWQAAVWTRSSQADHQFSCSGALVHPAWVLTSASCVAAAEPAHLKVTVGDWDLDETQPVSLPPVALDVTAVRTSPGRVWAGPFGPVLEPGRLAMLRITPELDGEEYRHVGPVCLPDTGLLRSVDQLRCVVTGWRGGAQPIHHLWRPQPQSDLGDILRKFETAVRHDPECQDVAHHLKLLEQRPPPPPFPAPYPPYPVPYSAAGLEGGLEPRAQYRFGPPPFFGPPPPPPPPQAAEQPALYVCPRDLRCIPDSGALLACVLPPPPPPPPPPHFRPGPPPPHPLPLFRSAQNDTDETAAAAAAAAAATGPADAYEQLSKSFRPPVASEQTAGAERARRSTAPEGDDGPPAGRSAFLLPHSIIGGPPPEPELPPPGVQPPPASTRHYDAYLLVGVASRLTAGCTRGQMIFDDVIQEAEFVQQVVHRGG